MPFPILRTPVVVLSEIISLLEPNEIVTASFCSTKVRRLLKCHHQRRKPLEWRLSLINFDCWGRADIYKTLDGEEIPVITARHISRQNESRQKLIETNEYKRAFKSGLVLYFENPVKGIKLVMDYVTDLFNLEIYALNTDRYGTWANDWINNRQEKLLHTFEFNENDRCHWQGDVEMDNVLRNVRASDYIILRDNVSANFRFDGKLGPANNLLVDSKGYWVTLDNLMNFDFVNIVIEESRISASDLQSFLEHWRAGGSNRLKFLKLNFEDVTDFENFEEEVEMEITQTDNVIEYHLSNGDGWHIHDGYSIQRNDGVKAVIDFDTQYFVMIVSHGR